MNSAVVTQINPETPIEKLPAKQAGLIQMMAAKYSMDPVQFANTVKKTAMPGNATTEEFAAFMMVAHEYKLNPLLKEIYAFPKKGGGIAPMVSIDGWVNIINSNDQLEFFNFEMHHDEKGNLFACTCTMKRKDRSAPTVVTEYLSECIRNTEPWKMKYRMLRHKSLIQAARYCFGLSGIYDEDEARDQAMKDITPDAPPRPRIQDFVTSESASINRSENGSEQVDEETGEVTEEETTVGFSAADAMEMGREAFRTKRPNRPPEEWRDGKNDSFAEAFKAGYDDEEASQKKPTASAAKTEANKEG